MKELFHIEEQVSSAKDDLLSIKLGENHVGFAITNSSGKKLRRLAYYNFETWDEEVENRLVSFQDAANKVIIAYDFPQSVLLEGNDQETNTDRRILQSIGNYDEDSIIQSDNITAYRIRNLYAVPTRVFQWVNEKFPDAPSIHEYSVALETHHTGDYPAELLVDFRTTDFTVMAWKDKKPIQAGSFPYVNPADVLFYLLRICQSFSLSQSSTKLSLSGLVDRESTLFTALYQYFLPISFSGAGWSTGSSYPPHFFGSFQKLATCAL